MPLRDHFRPPLDSLLPWEGFHATWPVMIVRRLRQQLPRRYLVLPRVHSGPRPGSPVVNRLPAQDVAEVRVFDEKSGRRLVAAVEIVSPANKDRCEHRQAFVSKCVGLLQERVSIVVVDVVTTRGANLYAELLETIGQSDPTLGRDSPSPYAAACRSTRPDKQWLLEMWSYPLTIGRPLPKVPLWVADDLVVPLELEESYEESCALLGVP